MTWEGNAKRPEQNFNEKNQKKIIITLGVTLGFDWSFATWKLPWLDYCDDEEIHIFKSGCDFFPSSGGCFIDECKKSAWTDVTRCVSELSIKDLSKIRVKSKKDLTKNTTKIQRLPLSIQICCVYHYVCETERPKKTKTSRQSARRKNNEKTFTVSCGRRREKKREAKRRYVLKFELLFDIIIIFPY